MKAAIYEILRVLACLVTLGAGILLSIILLWLIGSHGVITCGKGVLNGPDWLLNVLVLVGVPLSVFACAIALIVLCSRRLAADE